MEAEESKSKHNGNIIGDIHYCSSSYKITNVIVSFIELISCQSKPTDDEVVVHDIIPLCSMILALSERR